MLVGSKHFRYSIIPIQVELLTKFLLLVKGALMKEVFLARFGISVRPDIAVVSSLLEGAITGSLR